MEQLKNFYYKENDNNVYCALNKKSYVVIILKI